LQACSRHDFNCIGAIVIHCSHCMYILFWKKKNHGSHNFFTVLAWVGMILVFSSWTGPWAIPIMYCPCPNSRQLIASTI
jgi:hypothetical protein